MGHVVGYTRVSTSEQNVSRQLDGMQLDAVFTDVMSGKNAERPELQACLKYLRNGDELVVHEMSRLGRNTEDLLKIVRELVGRGVAVRFVHEKLSLTADGSPQDELMLTMFAAFATFERGLMLQRQREGIELAKQAGKYKGRAPKLDKAQVENLRAWVARGETISAVAREFGISRASVHNYVKSA